MSLWDQLNSVLPQVLSSNATMAMNGTKLLTKVRPLLKGQYADSSLRQHFSDMAKDASTVNRESFWRARILSPKRSE